MIKLQVDPLPKESSDRLRSWFEKPEFDLLKNVLLCKVHERTAYASNLSMNKPFDQFTEGSISEGAAKAMSEAATWKIVLDKLIELSQPQSEFSIITSTSYSHARPD